MLYLSQDGEGVALSSVPLDHEHWESEHVTLVDDHYRGSKGTYAGTRNMVTNVLRAAGVQFTEE